MKRVIASAPSKVILFGEHAVVYGKGAIVSAIDKRTIVEATPSQDVIVHAPLRRKTAHFFLRGKRLVPKKRAEEYDFIKAALENVFSLHGSCRGMKIKIRSEAPVGAGLGSSASVVVATVAASSEFLGMKLSRQEIKEVSHKTEIDVQKASSGMDVTVSTFGGVMFYRNKKFSPLPVGRLPLAIGNTGEKGSTKRLVANVKRLHEKYPGITNHLFDAADSIAEEARKSLSGKPDLERLGELMNMNQCILESIGVSTPKLERLIHACRKAGAYGAKLTGAGGGGCMVALGRNLDEAIRKAGGIPVKARLTEEGVRISKFS